MANALLANADNYSDTRAERRPSIVDDVMVGLRGSPKRLPYRLFYDTRGAELFEQICELDEYYLTRSELALLEAHVPAIAAAIGPRARVIEPGSGAGNKTRMLLSALDEVATYVPIDVSQEQLEANAASLRREFPTLEVLPICGDYTHDLTLPSSQRVVDRTVVFFPGSTIGNFEPNEAVAFLGRFAALAGVRGQLIIGADANHDAATLVPAYDDRSGVTAAFNLNSLVHLNRERFADFDISSFKHRAVWNAAHCRMEMQLVSTRAQTVALDGQQIHFDRNEVIVTEHCYKYDAGTMDRIVRSAGWRLRNTFIDDAGRMRLWLAERS